MKLQRFKLPIPPKIVIPVISMGLLFLLVDFINVNVRAEKNAGVNSDVFSVPAPEIIKEKVAPIVVEDRSGWMLGKIEPVLNQFSGIEERVPVIIYLVNQPFSGIARDVRKIYKPRLEEQRRKIQKIVPEMRQGKSFENKEDETSRVENLPQMTSVQRKQLKNILEEMDRLTREMKQEVAYRVTREISTDQEMIVSLIENNRGILTHRLISVNAVSAVVPPGALKTIAGSDLVLKIILDRTIESDLDVSVPTIGADTWWTNGYDVRKYSIFLKLFRHLEGWLTASWPSFLHL